MLLLSCALAATVLGTVSTFNGTAEIDRAIEGAIHEGRLPGAVILIGHRGKVVFRKAYGNRAIVPKTEPMEIDTIFDCASLSKVVATTTCLMKLLEEGRFRLNDRITEYIPEFQGGHSEVTIRNLMTHFSGLRPDVPLSPHWEGYETGIHLACVDPPQGLPGVAHVYSDINFLLLGELVHRLSGKTLKDYARANVFEPLGMKDSFFQPDPALRSRIAPTEQMPGDSAPLLGVVHDPTARNMGGIAGHAGLFSTADDLARFAQMMLNRGTFEGKTIVSSQTVEKFTEPQTPLGQPILRGLGWDIDSPYSSNRGELFPIGSYGHTGFTGTSIWIDPTSQSYVILLSNAVHPKLTDLSIVSLRSRISTIAARAVGVFHQENRLTGSNDLMSGPGVRRAVYRHAETKTGLEMARADGFKSLLGKRVGLITNQSGRGSDGQRNIDLMRKAGVNLVALFSPEHGFASKVDEPGIKNSVDEASGLPIWSLYGDNLRPSAEQLKGLDVLVYDIQDVGVRFYTYETTLAYAMEEAARAHLSFVVLDRPNPLTGRRVEGPVLDAAQTSFVGYFPGMPVAHGMTVGELAEMFKGERKLDLDLNVVKMDDWERGDWFDQTGITWTNPSPNMRSLKAATLYPGLCLVEFAENLSVGRGTDSPFEQVGADFIDGRALASYLNDRALPGVRAYATRFTPTASRFAGHEVSGIRFEIVDREQVAATRIGLELACALQALYPGKIDWEKGKDLLGSEATAKQIAAGDSPDDIEDRQQAAIQAFEKVRAKYLLYR